LVFPPAREEQREKRRRARALPRAWPSLLRGTISKLNSPRPRGKKRRRREYGGDSFTSLTQSRTRRERRGKNLLLSHLSGTEKNEKKGSRHSLSISSLRSPIPPGKKEGRKRGRFPTRYSNESIIRGEKKRSQLSLSGPERGKRERSYISIAFVPKGGGKEKELSFSLHYPALAKEKGGGGRVPTCSLVEEE